MAPDLQSGAGRARAGVPGTVLVACVAAVGLASGTAGAAPQYEAVPSLSLRAGADSNVLFDGLGGDRVGRGSLRLLLRAHDRDWGLRGDVSGGLLGFQTRGRVVPLGEGTFKAHRRFSRDTQLTSEGRLRGADDPLALAQLGVLGGGGLTLGWRSRVDLRHRLDRSWSVGAGARFDGVEFFDPALAARGGLSVGGSAHARWRANRWLSFIPELEARTFLGDGFAGWSAGAVPAVRLRLARRTFADVAAGALMFFDARGSLPFAVARAGLTWDGRHAGLALAAAQDLQVPMGRGGVTQGQLLEAVARWGAPGWELRGRAGGYRSRSDVRSDTWAPGYGVEAGAFVRLAPVVWMGLSALHFARLPAGGAPGMTREAVYLRLELGGGRP